MKNKWIIVLLLIVAMASVAQALLIWEVKTDVQVIPGILKLNDKKPEPITTISKFQLGFDVKAIDGNSIQLSYQTPKLNSIAGYIYPELYEVGYDDNGFPYLMAEFNVNDLTQMIRKEGGFKGIGNGEVPVDLIITGQFLDLDTQTFKIFGGTGTVVFYK